MSLLFVFFQAEDGIRDIGVTGVQTCALPIYPQRPTGRPAGAAEQLARLRRVVWVGLQAGRVPAAPLGRHGRPDGRVPGEALVDDGPTVDGEVERPADVDVVQRGVAVADRKSVV